MPTYVFFDYDAKIATGMQKQIMKVPASKPGDSFQFRPRVLVGDIIALVQKHKLDVLVSPANSFGGMDGGIDGIYSKMMPGIGPTVQYRIAQLGAKTRSGRSYLPIGSACLVPVQLHPQLAKTGCQTKYLISAPTMFYPQSLRRTPQNVYYVMLSLLHLTEGLPDDLIVAVPGLGTGVGGLSGMDCGFQMASAMIDFQKYRSDPDNHPLKYETKVKFTTNANQTPPAKITELYYLGDQMACHQTLSYSNQDIPCPSLSDSEEEPEEEPEEESEQDESKPPVICVKCNKIITKDDDSCEIWQGDDGRLCLMCEECNNATKSPFTQTAQSRVLDSVPCSQCRKPVKADDDLRTVAMENYKNPDGTEVSQVEIYCSKCYETYMNSLIKIIP